jgi:hypothetical protein
MTGVRAHPRSSDSICYEHTAAIKDMEEFTLAEKVRERFVIYPVLTDLEQGV